MLLGLHCCRMALVRDLCCGLLWTLMLPGLCCQQYASGPGGWCLDGTDAGELLPLGLVPLGLVPLGAGATGDFCCRSLSAAGGFCCCLWHGTGVGRMLMLPGLL